MSAARSIAVVGGGWAGLSAAVTAVDAGARVTLFEAARVFGGRARTVLATMPDGAVVPLDNGQHVLAGAYTATLALMRRVGVSPEAVLQRQPLDLRLPNDRGLALAERSPPWDVLLGVLGATGWTWADRLGLLQAAYRWHRSGFRCPDEMSVADLCSGLSQRVQRELVAPLCVSALNTPMHRASAQVFLRVLADALFSTGDGGLPGSCMLLPRTDLGRLLPQPAAHWLVQRGATLRPGRRVQSIAWASRGWLVDGESFDAVVLATPPWEAQRLAASVPAASGWAAVAGALRHEAIATVYARGDIILPRPMLALPAERDAPAQFVFDRGRLGGPHGLLAFVVSAAQGERDTLEPAVLHQAARCGWKTRPVLTVVEKRATFACTPRLRRPGPLLADNLVACGDYIEGPYPATLEGAVRSGDQAVRLLNL